VKAPIELSNINVFKRFRNYSPGFPARGTHRGQRCAAFFTESRMQFDGTTKLHRKSGFGLYQLRNRCSPEADHREAAAENDAK
jgi:hypothetical protein